MSVKDPLRYFRVEAREISEELGHGARELGAAPTQELIARMMRLAHTLKGAAAIVKQREIAELTHALEDALAPLRAREGDISAALVDAVTDHVDAIATAVAALDPERVETRPVRNAAGGTLEETTGLLHAEAREVDALLGGIAEARVGLRGMHRTVSTIVRARQLAELVADWTARSTSREGGVPRRMREFADELRVLVADAELRLRNCVEQHERDLASVHAAAEQLRLLPCSAAFGAFERAVLESAQALGKRAALTIRGGETRLDPQVLGLVQRAVVQLLRNAVAHGIELPGERESASKPETGAVTVEVARRGNRIVIACSDDGSGIDLAAVRSAAEARGLPIGDGNEAALIGLLLSGGVSTSGEVTEASGRGVGLDVVREVAGRLGAQLSATSRAGQGIRVELAIPVRLSSLDALVVEAGGTVVALPLGAVRRAIRLSDADIARAGKRETIQHDGAAIGLASLDRAMRLPAVGRGGGPSPAVILAGNGSPVALRVDSIVGMANLVVRAVPPEAPADGLVAGIWFDADGVPRPVADPASLAETVSELRPTGNVDVAPALPPVLVIDDSLTTRVLEQRILESAGFSVDLASSAEEGLEMARQRRYGLFLIDVEMPGMDGFEFVETARADPGLREVPAVLVSSRGAQEDIDRGLAAGAHAYFVKSEFDQRRVLDTIRQLLGGA